MARQANVSEGMIAESGSELLRPGLWKHGCDPSRGAATGGFCVILQFPQEVVNEGGNCLSEQSHVLSRGSAKRMVIRLAVSRRSNGSGWHLSDK